MKKVLSVIFSPVIVFGFVFGCIVDAFEAGDQAADRFMCRMFHGKDCLEGCGK